MTALARVPSFTISVIASRNFSRFGVALASWRRQKLALVTTPVSGWLTSWAIEATSSPIAITRVMWASSACASCNASWAPLTLGNFLSQLLVDGCKLSGPFDDAMLQLFIESPDFQGLSGESPIHCRRQHSYAEDDEDDEHNSSASQLRDTHGGG